MKKPSKSFEIALSALACAVAAGFLMLGSVNSYLLATGCIIGTFAIMVPLSKEFYWGASLAYLGACLIALPLCLWQIIPFAVFFGLHPIVNRLQKRRVSRPLFHALCFLGKAAWFDGAMLLSWYVLSQMAGFVFPDVLNQYIYLIIFAGGTAFFAAYDYLIFLCQRSVDAIVRRIRR